MSTAQRKVVDTTDQGGVTLEVRDRVMLIGIDRSSKRNALTPKIMRELSAAYAAFDQDNELRCALLFGHGTIYCAGFDLTLLKQAVAEGMEYGNDRYDPFGLTGRRLSKPLVVAVHGACFAGGLELALNGDVIVAAQGTLFGQPEVARGVFAFVGGAIRWLQGTTWGNAQVHLLTGDTLTAEEALRIGLVQEIVAPSFSWKDYRQNSKVKVMTLNAEEFIRRFLLHSLPDGFHRIRHYGFLANGGRSDKLALCRQLLALRSAWPDRQDVDLAIA